MASYRQGKPTSASHPIAGRSWRLALAVAVLVVVAAVAGYFGLRQVSPGNAVATAEPGEPLALEFENGTGATRSLAWFRGKAVLLNFWATWCAPCREEMPALDRLQAKLGGDDFQVVALSLDRGGPERASQFLLEISNRNLTLYVADLAEVRREIGVFGLPTTLFIDRDGREVHRVVGPAAWDSPEMIAEITTRLGLRDSAAAETEGLKP